MGKMTREERARLARALRQVDEQLERDAQLVEVWRCPHCHAAPCDHSDWACEEAFDLAEARNV